MQKLNVTQKLIQNHLLSGEMTPGDEIGLKIDQLLQQDATGTLVMLESEALNLDKTKVELAVQYVDHNLLQTDFKNMDDHLFLQSAAQKYGYWYSRSGNGISHVVHQESFGIPGKTMIGSDSHTPSAGAIGMLAMGTGGIDLAMVSAGEPYYVNMPKIMGVELNGKLNDWVSAKDVILEMLRRYDVKGLRGYIVEYFGDGLENLSVWDRHVIANMGTELGATTTVFPSDENTKNYFIQQQRENDWKEILPDIDAGYDDYTAINLSEIVPLIALPGSPGNVVPVEEVAGREIAQVVVGSSANPGLRDFWIVSKIIENQFVNENVSLDINPSSRQVLQNIIKTGGLASLLNAGAKLHQSGCMGCIGMGQAPATDTISLRTMPRNFPGRSGTKEDKVYLCSPETAAASAITGKITDPRSMSEKFQMDYPKWQEPKIIEVNRKLLVPPTADKVSLKKGPNIKSLPDFDALPNNLEVPVLLKMKDNISTDEILKAGAEVLPLRSNIQEISKFTYSVLDESFYEKSKINYEKYKGFCVIAGENYAQGSSREHAALAPRYLGQKFTIAKSYARIGWQNLINFGVIPFVFTNPEDYQKIDEKHLLILENIHKSIKLSENVRVKIKDSNTTLWLTYNLSERQKDIILAGGVINYVRQKQR